MKNTLKAVFFKIRKMAYPYEFILMGPKGLFQYWFFQKILRINSHVPWPAHWTSTVLNVKNITFLSDLKHDFSPLGYSPGSYIQAMNGIICGRNIIHGPGIKIISANHNLNEFRSHISCSPIEIGDNCWLGADCIILPGVKLGNHTIVAAGAVVTKSFLKGDCVIAGNPAKIIKKIADYSGSNYFK